MPQMKLEMKMYRFKMKGRFFLFLLPALGISAVLNAQGLMATASPSIKGMQQLEDDQLSVITGQALFNMAALLPNDAGNNETSNNVGFYKVGLEAELALNANIRKLQLGCGGVNGIGGCDIDIDNFSISGGDGSTREGRVSSDAILTNPFVEFAVKNPGSSTLREIVGLRLSAETTTGLLTFGEQNLNTPNGINSLSGYMTAQSDSSGRVKGYARTAAAYYDAGQYPLTGEMTASLGVEAGFETIQGGFWIPAINDPDITKNLAFDVPALVINGNRLQEVVLQDEPGGGNDNDMNTVPITFPTMHLNYDHTPVTGTYTYGASAPLQTQGGPFDARVTDCSDSVLGIACAIGANGKTFGNVVMQGDVNPIIVNTTFRQHLGYIHKIEVTGSPFYLSLQGQDLRWPGTKPDDIAQKGWWMSFADPVTIGLVNPQDIIDLGAQRSFWPQLQNEISECMKGNNGCTRPEATSLAQVLRNEGLNVAISDPLNINPIALSLSNLRLAGQDFQPNCYGSYAFC